MNWSGGKDSALALYDIQQQQNYRIDRLLTTFNRQADRVSMHGLRRDLLREQAEVLSYPLQEVDLPEMSDLETYNRAMAAAFEQTRKAGLTHGIFGDIFLEDLRQYRERQLREAGLEGVFPLWGQSTRSLMDRFIDLGFRSVVICVSAERLDKSFLGRELDTQFLRDLPDGVDPCGENGEYHTFVYDGPIFARPVTFRFGERVYRSLKPEDEDVDYDTGFWYLDLLAG